MYRAVAVLMLLVAGCSSIRVVPAEGPTITGAWRVSAVTGHELSPRTLQSIRRLDLEALYPERLAELVAKLHQAVLADPEPDLLFTLAEVNYLRGVRAEKEGKPEAVAYFYLSAGYAYHFLFDGSQRKGEIQQVGKEITVSEAFDPRFRLACDCYNAGLARCIAAAQRVGRFDPRQHLVLPTRDGASAITIRVSHRGFTFKPEDFGPVRLCSEFEVQGLANHHRTFGLGVPLVGSHAENMAPSHGFYPARVNFPVTAFFHFEGGLADLHEHRAGWLEFVNPLANQTIEVRGRSVPLESDLTTPLAFYLSRSKLEAAGYAGFLNPDSLGDAAGLHSLEPYQPGKIPVILVHGLLASPLGWAPMFNDLQADPELRKRFQFWVYFYPTAQPFLITAAQLRADLGRIRQTLDPARKDAALDDMVLVGHSMGGLVSRLLTVDGGDDFWKVASTTPFDQLHLEPIARVELRNTFYFERQPFVRRAIFLGTPHRGSKVGPSLLGRIGTRLAGISSSMMDLQREILEDNPQLASSLAGKSLPTSVDLLDPDSPALQLLASRPPSPEVRYHSVIGISSRNTLVLERLFGGGYCQPSDGVVPYSSAHLEGVASERLVPADHYHVHQHPLAILEVRRILYEHVKAFDERTQPVRRAEMRSAAQP